jgi:hypothetical protein
LVVPLNKVMFATVTTDPTSMFATIQLDIECPKSIARAMAIDAETGTTYWQDAIHRELEALKPQLVFYVRPDTLQHKARLVVDHEKMEVDTAIFTDTIYMNPEVQKASHPPKSKPGPKKQKPKKVKKPTKKGKKNKGKFPKKAKSFSKDNPGAYVTAAVWKRMSKEEQQAARASRREQGIPTRSNNSPHLQFPSFDSVTPEVDNDPHPLEAAVGTKQDPIAHPLELQKIQIVEPNRKIQGFQRHLLRPPKAVQPWSLI